MKKPILIVQGAQWGSEAKGAIAAHLCVTRNVNYAVRTGATNAGHTCYYGDKAVKLQQLPVGFVNPDTVLVIGAGALIDPVILDREVALLSSLTGTDIRKRLVIDYRAGLHLPVHHERSAGSGRHVTMGATGKGCSEALIDRINGRGHSALLFGDTEYSHGYHTEDTESILNVNIDKGAQVLLEGTQGQMLDLYLGPYPYVTHKQTGPAQWMLECGLSPALPTEIVAVVRSYPIRVAGNSGPMPGETSWPELARVINTYRASFGLTSIVKPENVKMFEEAVEAATEEARSNGTPVPSLMSGNRQQFWRDREKYRDALSTINTTAWLSLPEEAQMDLSNLFELTTVTKKLRRIAMIHPPTLQKAGRQMRPSWAVLTFANYLWPENWYAVPTNGMDYFSMATIEGIEYAVGCKVEMMTWGPASRHVQSRNA